MFRSPMATLYQTLDTRVQPILCANRLQYGMETLVVQDNAMRTELSMIRIDNVGYAMKDLVAQDKETNTET